MPAFVSTNFHCSLVRREFDRNSPFVENFRAVVGYHAYKYTRYTPALPIVVDSQPAALLLSKYRLALRATLLVWPRTSRLIISHGLSIRSGSSRFPAPRRLLLIRPPSPSRGASFVCSASREADTGKPTSFYSSDVASSRLYTLSIVPRRRKNIEYTGLSASESNCLYTGGDSRHGNDRQLLRISNSTGAISRGDVTSGKIVAVLDAIRRTRGRTRVRTYRTK